MTTEAPNSFDTNDAIVAPSTTAIALAAMITMAPTDIPSAISTPSSTAAPGPSTAHVVAIIGVITTIALSVIALWQGGQKIWYPMREHQETMKTLVAQRKTAEELLKAAEEGSLRREMAQQVP
ncbi:hypothetical protein FRB94_008758 [Tulasnella sp. JGI-2019a]|nr:hypothetical protein FRB94_008758 [Tulasnella sp. JGI-2019a]KAG9028675.1 hypothetical protein FRB95_006178 [Tulasnella sp. JGI-2019a]